MQELHAQMKEYLKMTEMLPFNDFNAYYKKLMDYLQNNYQDMPTEELVQAKAICSVLTENSGGRAGLDKANRKKFQKIEEKTRFWADAITLRLKKDGIGAQELKAKEDAVFAAEEPEAE